MNSGFSIPQLGFGVWLIDPSDTSNRVSEALEVGYRHFDTAPVYNNERGVGDAIRHSDIPRDEIFVTTKLWNDQQGGDKPRESLLRSLDELSLEYVDLFLIHWPVPAQDLYLHAWEKLVELQEAGLVKSIGVSNHNVDHLDRIITTSGRQPALNQVELHPAHQQRELQAWAASHDTKVASWGPLGQGQYPLLDTPPIVEAARHHGKSPAQIVIRWHVQQGFILTPKSSKKSRMKENIDVFDFELTPAEMQSIHAMNLSDGRGRVGQDPAKFNDAWVPAI
ncbi:MAG: aldo/keto reductase [Leucobacter sp.]